jgi:predicted lipid-binding transport protein (Tim44 family)
MRFMRNLLFSSQTLVGCSVSRRTITRFHQGHNASRRGARRPAANPGNVLMWIGGIGGLVLGLTLGLELHEQGFASGSAGGLWIGISLIPFLILIVVASFMLGVQEQVLAAEEMEAGGLQQRYAREGGDMRSLILCLRVSWRSGFRKPTFQELYFSSSR